MVVLEEQMQGEEFKSQKKEGVDSKQTDDYLIQLYVIDSLRKIIWKFIYIF